MGIAIKDLLRLTWKSLSSDFIRSGLTTLGVFMGVAAVNATLNIQSITTAQLAQKLAQRDRPFVEPYLSSESGIPPTLGEADQQALKKNISLIRSISQISYLYGLQSVQFEAQTLKDLNVQSVSLNYLDTTGRRMLQGRFFNQADFDQYRPVAIVDQKLATSLFQGKKPLQQALFVGGNRLLVVGVTESKSRWSSDKSPGTLWITEPYATSLQASFGYSSLQISAHHLEDINPLKQKLEKALQVRYPQATIYLSDNAKDLLKEKETQEIAGRALTGVGLIALAIGGIGIANITIASVIERTKEIGIRRAIGATRGEIILQLMLEAVVLSLVGGISAIAVVHGLTAWATSVVISAPYQFSIANTAFAIAAALLVGVSSSFFPALYANKIDIVKALRSE
jgi:putative ABC transport system permease protein